MKIEHSKIVSISREFRVTKMVFPRVYIKLIEIKNYLGIQ